MNIKQQDDINLIISLVNIPLMVNEWVISWYISLGISLLTFHTDYQRGAWGLCVTRCISIMNTCYGLYKWTAGSRKSKNKLQITKMTSNNWLSLLGLAVIGWGFFYVLLTSLIPEQWQSRVKYPALDALISTIVFVGQRLSAHKKLESQLLWFVYNIIMICNRGIIQGTSLWVKHFVYLPLCLWGYTVWRRKYKKAQRKHDDS